MENKTTDMFADIDQSDPFRRGERPVLFEGVNVVSPNGLIEDTFLFVEEGRIASIGEHVDAYGAHRIDAKHLLLMPGIVDLHSDALERAIEPRPRTTFPVELALIELDKTLAACGITTMFHCVALVYTDGRSRSLRTIENALRISAEIKRLAPVLRTRSHVHLRYDVLAARAAETVVNQVRSGRVAVVSLMDHSPGQGQFSNLAAYREAIVGHYRVPMEDVDRTILQRQIARSRVDDEALGVVCRECASAGIAVASHDDDSLRKVQWARGLGATISEFPVNMEAVIEATDSGMGTVLGAPNLVRGGGQTGTINVQEALRAGYGDALCSDCSPMSMIHAVFHLSNLGLRSLHESVAMVSLEPARLAGISGDIGSIEVGKRADLILVDPHREVPEVLRTFLDGAEVYRAL